MINYWYELSKITYMKPILKYLLIKAFNDPAKIFNASDYELRSRVDINSTNIKYIRSVDYSTNIDEYLLLNDIEMVNIHNELYPKLLKEIYDPPVNLFIKGNNKNLNSKCISVVGSRMYSDYGKKITKIISNELNEYTIVSGMAKGIDGFAHLNAKKTIAIFGNGLNICYPIENKYIREHIMSNGCIVSEYIPNEKPNKIYFPCRNRIISGLSIATIVIEASNKSGSLITGNFALEQGREVFALPHNINSGYNGTNRLISDGANIVIEIKDLVNSIKNLEI